MFTKLLFISLFISLIYAHSFSSLYNSHKKSDLALDSDAIDQIMTRHWKTHLNSLEANKRREVEERSSQAPSKERIEDWSYECQHDRIAAPKYNKLKAGLTARSLKRDAEPSPIPRKQQAWEPIRFYTNNTFLIENDPAACYTVGSTVLRGNYSNGPCTDDLSFDCTYTCTATDILTPALKTLFKDSVVPAVLEIFEEVLTIQRVQGNLQLNRAVWEEFGRECFPGVPIGSDLVAGLGNGIANTDMIVSFTARPDADGVVAYALGCNFDWDQSSNSGIFGRPLYGLVNFVPTQFQVFQGTYSEFDFKAAVKVGVHEFTHALGFTSFYYQSFKNIETGAVYPGGTTKTVLVTGNSPSGSPYAMNISKLTTPRLLDIARSHYSCETLDGIDLEEFGGAGTAGSHWEKRIVQNEYMAGYVNPLMPVTYLTLALFQDMGFYKADLTKSQYWTWGKDTGCTFFDRCETAPAWQNPGYFCTQNRKLGCTADRQAKGICLIDTYTQNLPAYYSHFTNPKLGGEDIPSDLCSFNSYVVFCANASETPNSAIGEVFGADSQCFEYGVDAGVLASSPSQGCFQQRCNEYHLEFNILNKWYRCPLAGGSLNVDQVGVVNCPTSSLVCRDVVNNIFMPSESASDRVRVTGFIIFSAVMFFLCFQEWVLHMIGFF